MDITIYYSIFTLIMIIRTVVAAWIYNDASNRDENSLVWIMLTFMSAFLGILLWFVFRRRTYAEERYYQHWYSAQPQQPLQSPQAPPKTCSDCNTEIAPNETRCRDCQSKLVTTRISNSLQNPLSIPNILFILIASQFIGALLAIVILFLVIIGPNLSLIITDIDTLEELILSPISIVITLIFGNGTLIVFTYLRAVRPREGDRLSLSEMGLAKLPKLSVFTKWFIVGLLILVCIWVVELFLLPQTEESVELFVPENLNEYLILILGAAVIVPIGEEFFFRGYAFTAVAKNWNINIAYIFSALLFAILHFNLVGFIPLFLIGVVFAVILKQSGSLLPCIILHAVNNFVAISLLYWF
ncbi:MAG: CPBP family intramembrane metalloprotease [Thermoplasmata archaeon]|nr:CPBP family intramembrane metalloprotease [Thermoplasmata archaeon]